MNRAKPWRQGIRDSPTDFWHGLRFPGAAGLALALAVWLGPDTTFITLSGIGLLLFARSKEGRLAAIALPAVARLALEIGVFHFTPPDQIVDLAARGVSVLALILQNDIWWPRYLFTYPAVAAMDIWGLRFDYSFALYCAAILPFEVVALDRAANAAAQTRAWTLGRLRLHVALLILLATLVFALASQMNGRLIPAHVGYATLLAAQTTAIARRRLAADTWVLTALGLTMAQMSSGTGVVAYAQVVCGLCIYAFLNRGDAWSVIGGVALISGVAGPFLYRSLDKNISFFGGGFDAISGLLHHGAGGFLLDRPGLLFVAVLSSLVAVALLLRSVRAGALARVPRIYLPAMAAIPLALGGGLFGYSTLTMVFPPTFLLATIPFQWSMNRASRTASGGLTI